MYEERNNNFSLKDFILQVLFVVLFILLLVWLFPTKSYLNKKLEGAELGTDSRVESLYKRLYAENLETMKNAAKSYFTTERLPKNVGQTKKITLKELLDSKLLLPIIDSNNKECNSKKSYVEMTKEDTQYVLKAYLACSDNEDYVLEYLGCYNYCSTGLCEVAKEEVKPVVNKTKEYQYKKVTNGTCGDYGAWSDWTKEVITETAYTKVDTKTEQVKQEVKRYGVIGTKDEVSTVYADYTITCPVGYTLNGTKCTKRVSSSDSVAASISGSWTTISSSSLYSRPQTSSGNYKYTLIATKTKGACGNCTYAVNYFYKVEQYVTSSTCPSGYSLSGSTCYKSTSYTDTKTATISCPTGYTYDLSTKKCAKTTTNTVDVYGYYNDYETVSVKYYRSATKSCTDSSVDYKWSTSNNDKSLLNKGYALTGTTR